MRRRLPPCTAALAMLLATPTALADRVALLPPRGGTDDTARLSAKAEILQGLTALGHTAVPDPDVDAALKTTWDGVADTADEYRAVGTTTRADWVLVGLVEPAIQTTRIELLAYRVSSGRLETVAREVDRSQSLPQTQEMLGVLVRPEGIGPGELPWERAAPPLKPSQGQPPPPLPVQQPEPPPPTPRPPSDGRIAMDYPLGTARVKPAYSAGNRVVLSVLPGFAIAAVRPDGATGDAGSFVGAARLGYAAFDFGLEPFVQVGGNLAGPPAVWIDAGARLLLTPGLRDDHGSRRGTPLHIGPEIVAGVFLRPGPEASGPGGLTYSGGLLTDVSIGAALDVILALSPSLQLEAQLGNLRWIPADGGSLLLLGATLGAGLRF